MLFNSKIFFIFAIIFFAIWPLVKNKREIKFLVICTASFIFYGWWDWRFLFLIIFSGLIDYFAALAMIRFPRHRKLYLVLSLLGNLGSLAIFKYSSFFVQSINASLIWAGIDYTVVLSIPDFFLILPVGISFYTFQSMSYTIDVYRKQLAPTKSILHFFSYLSMFPQLVAGPIVRAKDILYQLMSPQKLTSNCYIQAYKLIAYGYLKKVVIADNLAPIVNRAFSALTMNDSSLYWWGIMIAFALQIYGDFSGYSDIAIGLGRLMGLRFKRNFNHPYVAVTFQDFWQRWHISLSTWFRDYVYIALGGNRKGLAYSFLFLWITMLTSGLWHGASWNFVVWGALHALFLCIDKVVPNHLWKLIGPMRWLYTFSLILLSWVFFRAESIDQAFEIIKIMLSFSGRLSTGLGITGEVLIGAVVLRHLYCHFLKDSFEKKQMYPTINAFIVPLVIVISIFFRGPGSQFIYFQF